jgi:hypothetical protein
MVYTGSIVIKELIMWNYEGFKVSGLYLSEFPVTGTVKSSRVAYGGEVHHYVDLDEPLSLPFTTELRKEVILNHKQIEQVSSR